jgi:hypothetical protein
MTDQEEPQIGETITFTREWINEHGMCEECKELPASYFAPDLTMTHFTDNDPAKPVTQKGFRLCPICAALWASHGEELERLWQDEEDEDYSFPWEELDARFTTLPNPSDPTEGDHWEHADAVKQPLNNVWTIVEGETGNDWWALTGFHIVNKLFYVVTKEEWTDDDSAKNIRY